MDEQLDSWMDQGPTVAPSRIAEATRAEIRITHQRRASWPAWRLAPMNNALRIAVVAAGILAAALIGYRLLTNPSVGPQPSPTVVPTSQTTASVDPAAYAISIPEVSPIQIDLTLPAGWSRGGWNVAKNDAFLGVWPVENVYADPCLWDGTLLDPPVGPTVEDLASALAEQPQRDATSTDVTMDGYAGTLVTMSVPADINLSNCDGGMFASWSEAGSDSPSRFAQRPGQIDVIYILDVEGTRVVIDGSYLPSTSATDVAEFEEIIASIDIQP